MRVSPIAAAVTITLLAGCASPAPVQPQKVAIKADSFCHVMRRLNPPHGVPTWDTADSKETIEGNRRIEAAVAQKCRVTKPTHNQPTS